MKKAIAFLTALILIPSGLMILSASSINCAETEAQVPSYSIGDWWKYRFNETATWGMNGNITMKVIGESMVTVFNTEYDCYEAEITGEGEAIDPFPYLPATWTMIGKEYWQKSDLAPVKSDSVIEWDITLDPFTKMKVIMNVTYSPPFNNSDFPLTVGKTWSIITNVNTTIKVIIDSTEISDITETVEMNYNFEVLGTEMITVVGGTFDTIVVRGIEQEGGHEDYYYPPEVRNIVKSLHYDVEDTLIQSLELIEYTLHHEVPFDYTQIIILAVVIVVIAGVAIIYFMRGKKPPTPSEAPRATAPPT
ncbi:MAG: hypothetical protein H3Z50_03890 [archaeon]|nr:hypothetical protein [archaeon]MCP8306595.1 hypothetical protein [archaeon]